jgi:hypothetical protein
LAAHDGEHDFMLTLDSLQATKPLTLNPLGQFQDVEVQQTPAPLPLLGVGAAFGFSRNLRKRIKGSKLPEAMSALG